MSETTEYPQDAKPIKSRSPLKIALASLAGAVIVVAGTWGGIAYASGVTAQRAHLTALAEKHQVEQATPHLEAQTAAIADESDTTSADDVVAAEKAREAQVAAEQAAAAAAAAQAAKAHSASSGGHPAGTRVPFIPSSDPNNANGGDYADPGTYCDSHSASTVGGVPVCD